MERFAVSAGADSALLWDLAALRRVRNIGGRGTSQVAFLHSGNCLVTLSRTEGISLYHFPTLDLRAKLCPDTALGVPVSLRCFAITANRMHLVAATAGRCVPRAAGFLLVDQFGIVGCMCALL